MPAAPRTPAPKKTGFGRKTPHGVLQVDWPFFGELCRALALKIFREYAPDVVIGIAKAGGIPGAVVASMLQRDFASVAVAPPEAGARPVARAAPPRHPGRRAAATRPGRRLESATASADPGGFVRALNRGSGWGTASSPSLDQLAAMVARADELSRAVRLERPIQLAPVPAQRAEGILDLDGDVRGVPLAEKKRLIEAYNGAMLAVSDRIVDTLATYRDEVSEYWYVNSEGAVLHELRPEVTLSGTAVARRDGTIEKGLESIGLRRGWRSVQDKAAGFRAVAERAVQLLDAPTVTGGTYPVVLDPELAGVFIHEAFGHRSEERRVGKEGRVRWQAGR